jgi:hypothetical protein
MRYHYPAGENRWDFDLGSASNWSEPAATALLTLVSYALLSQSDAVTIVLRKDLVSWDPYLVAFPQREERVP